MRDELELLRAADPAPAGAGRWRDRPLDATAEHALTRLLHGARTRRARRRLVLRAEAAVLALVAVLAFTLTGAGSGRAAAAPAALVPQAGTTAPSLDALARIAGARAAAAGPDDGPRRGSHLQSWSLAAPAGPDAAPPVTVPEERITRWNADGSGSELVVATDPRHPGRPVIQDDGGRWRTVGDGKVLHRAAYPAGYGTRHGGLAARTAPPTDPRALRTLLTSLYGAAGGGADGAGDGGDGVPQLLLALSSYRQEWTPGPRETAAIVRLLADTRGLRPAGAVTDRLGRRGLAFVHDGPDGAADTTRQMVVLDPRTGTLLGTEITFTRDVPDFRITAGQVLSYEAWLP
ncbi:CU044_5270 family protein [Streptomyces sp. RS10V-4]|uniref:CU044_5270 family protein n=1 Tax=Streptomyces rhizoryzae TaxID=2932493 RepID=UPI0020042CE5|nr:CU044_5270 family protein [Streptomyces rhizoryzae]MCK7628194.1 CU044_5270 family protein [Streptomyces rhizoryzae]